jgi:hypothetical protein
MTKGPPRKRFSRPVGERRGRPRFTDYFDIGPDGDYIVPDSECTMTDEERRRWRNILDEPLRGPGCPEDVDTNRSLVKGWNIAERHGEKNKSAFVRRWFRSWYDKKASPTDVLSYVKRLNRQLKLSKNAMPVAEAGESTGAASEPDAPNMPARK